MDLGLSGIGYSFFKLKMDLKKSTWVLNTRSQNWIRGSDFIKTKILTKNL